MSSSEVVDVEKDVKHSKWSSKSAVYDVSAAECSNNPAGSSTSNVELSSYKPMEIQNEYPSSGSNSSDQQIQNQYPPSDPDSSRQSPTRKVLRRIKKMSKKTQTDFGMTNDPGLTSRLSKVLGSMGGEKSTEGKKKGNKKEIVLKPSSSAIDSKSQGKSAAGASEASAGDKNDEALESVVGESSSEGNTKVSRSESLSKKSPNGSKIQENADEMPKVPPRKGRKSAEVPKGPGHTGDIATALESSGGETSTDGNKKVSRKESLSQKSTNESGSRSQENGDEVSTDAGMTETVLKPLECIFGESSDEDDKKLARKESLSKKTISKSASETPESVTEVSKDTSITGRISKALESISGESTTEGNRKVTRKESLSKKCTSGVGSKGQEEEGSKVPAGKGHKNDDVPKVPPLPRKGHMSGKGHKREPSYGAVPYPSPVIPPRPLYWDKSTQCDLENYWDRPLIFQGSMSGLTEEVLAAAAELGLDLGKFMPDDAHLQNSNENLDDEASSESCCRAWTGLILGLHPANERRRYFVTPSLICWVQA